jgi:hypothetical protein
MNKTGMFLTMALMLGACSAPTDTLPTAQSGIQARGHDVHNATPMTPELERQVAAVRAATARFHRFETAQAEGWTVQYPAGCVTSPEGAQAFHYLNPSLVDGEIDLLRPELLMYEPQKNGSLELVGVDYAIPFDMWTRADTPTLLGQPLMRNEELGVWAIHIWAWRANPSGLFAPWNPDVSCEYAD